MQALLLLLGSGSTLDQQLQLVIPSCAAAAGHTLAAPLLRETSRQLKQVYAEQGEIFAAEGYGKATGDVGVCIATSGPGATNLVTGLADALLDSVPLVAITGQASSLCPCTPVPLC